MFFHGFDECGVTFLMSKTGGACRPFKIVKAPSLHPPAERGGDPCAALLLGYSDCFRDYPENQCPHTDPLSLLSRISLERLP
jgi:hypothetical protein